MEYDEESLVVSFKQIEVKYLAIGSLTYFQKFLIFIAIEAIVISDIINHFGLYHLSVIFFENENLIISRQIDRVIVLNISLAAGK